MANKKVVHQDLEMMIRATSPKARLLIGRGKDGKTFTKGMCSYDAGMVNRKTLLGYLRENQKKHYSRIPGTQAFVLLNPRLFLSMESLKMNIAVPTSADRANGFIHLASECYPFFDVYYRFDEDARTLTFRLGDSEKVLRLKENSRHDWKAEVNVLRCHSLEQLEEYMESPWLAITFVTMGRRLLLRAATDKEKKNDV